MNKYSLHLIAIIILLLYSIISSIYFIVDSNSLSFRFVIAIILIVIIYIAIKRDFYLPFLGNMAFPSSLIVSNKYPADANIEYTLHLDNTVDGTKIIYWASENIEHNKDFVFKDPYTAYNKYDNAGVATVHDGQATIRLKQPNEYKVPYKGQVDRHFHYRKCCENNVMLGPVETIYL